MKTTFWRYIALLAIFGLVTAACGSTAESVTDAVEETVEEVAEEVTDDEPEAEEEVMDEPEEEEVMDEPEEEVAENPFEGETIDLLIPFGPGGGTDTWGRAVAPFFEKYLGDDVRVSVFNDGSQTAAVSAFENATDHDGLNAFVSSGSISIPFLLDLEGVEYDYADFTGIIGSPVGGVVYVSTSLGVEDVAGLCAADVDLFMGSETLAGLDAVPALAFNLLGLEVGILQGLEGSGPIRTQFESGDFNIGSDTSGSKDAVDQLVADGLAVPLFTYGITTPDGGLAPDAAWPDLPTMADAFESCNGSAPSGEAWDAYLAVNTAGFAAQKNVWVHNDAPPERIAALQAAAVEILADEEFLALAADLIGEYQFVAGEDLTAQFEAASNLDPAAKAFMCDFLQNVHNVGGICGG